MSIQFPANPTDGQIVTYGSFKYTYFDSKKYWKTTRILGNPTVTARTTSSNVISPNQTITSEITGYTGYVLSSVTVNTASWIRLYNSNQNLINDATRAQTEDPSLNSGVITEIVSEGSGTFSITPGVYAVNSDVPITDKIYMRATNLSSTSTAISVTLNIIQIGV